MNILHPLKNITKLGRAMNPRKTYYVYFPKCVASQIMNKRTTQHRKYGIPLPARCHMIVKGINPQITSFS